MKYNLLKLSLWRFVGYEQRIPSFNYRYLTRILGYEPSSNLKYNFFEKCENAAKVLSPDIYLPRCFSPDISLLSKTFQNKTII